MNPEGEGFDPRFDKRCPKCDRIVSIHALDGPCVTCVGLAERRAGKPRPEPPMPVGEDKPTNNLHWHSHWAGEAPC